VDGPELYGAPEPEDEGPAFSERQADAIAEVVHQLRREFQDGVERMQQRILDVMVRAAPASLQSKDFMICEIASPSPSNASSVESRRQ